MNVKILPITLYLIKEEVKMGNILTGDSGRGSNNYANEEGP